MKNKINRIGIDLDDSSVEELIVTYLSIKHYLPKSKLRVFQSASGRGYHIEVKGVSLSILQSIFYRALFNDCPYRLVLALKKYFLTKNIKDLDIMFYKKYGSSRKEIDLEAILKPYKTIKGYPNIEYEDVQKVAKKISDKILPKNEYILCIEADENKEKVKKKISKLCDKNGLRFRTFQNYYPNSNYLIVVYSEDIVKLTRLRILFKFKLKKIWVKEIKIG